MGNSITPLSRNISLILDELYLSDINALVEPEILKENKITRIITVLNKKDAEHAFEAYGTKKWFDVLHLELNDLGVEKISDVFPKAFAFIEGSKGKVLVHCAAGMSRSATIVIAYIMQKKAMNLREAYQFVKKRRNMIQPNTGFIKQLLEFEDSLLVIIEKLTHDISPLF